MKFKNFLYKVALIALIFFNATGLIFAQLNPPEVHRVLLKNTPDVFQITSFGALSASPYPSLVTSSGFSWTVSNDDPNVWNVNYTPEEDVVGSEYTHFQYREEGTGNAHPVNFTTVHYEIVNSIIEVHPDYITINEDETVSINPLVNDNTTASILSISSIVQSSNGIVDSFDSNSISFTPDAGYVGIAYVTYVVEDDLGSFKQGLIHINVVPEIVPVDETINLMTSNEQKLTIGLESDSYTIDINSDIHGNSSISGSFLIYSPNGDAGGIDNIEIVGDGVRKIYNITVNPVEHDYGFVRNDVYYTSVNTTTSFNVLDNDLKSNYPIIEYSEELEMGEESGTFTYTPPMDFEGVKIFTYTVWNGFEFQFGDIKIIVGDHNPKPLNRYEFHTAKNNPVLINYDIPIENFYYETSITPANGSIEIVGEQALIDFDCESINATRSVIYYPNNDFIGDDDFEIKYCVNNDSDCQLLKIRVHVVEEFDDCHCIDNCVWSGDANNDGVVRVDDLLAIAYNVGQVGSSRSDLVYDNWLGQSSSDWSSSMYNGVLNTKHSDSDGNGIVSVDDINAINDNYKAYHNLLKDDYLTVKNYPFILTPLNDVLVPNDLFVMDIELGSEEYPVEDLLGVSFTIFVGSFADSASLNVNFDDNTWLSVNAPSVQLSKVPSDGFVEAAFSTTNRISKSGYGHVGYGETIIEDDIDDTRLGSDRIPVRIQLRNATGTDLLGNKIRLPDAETVVYLDLSKDSNKPVSDKDLICYPNPSSDILNIHLNGQHIIQDIGLFDLQGRRLYMKKGLNQNASTIDLSGFNNGLYLLKVNTSEGVISKKVEVFNR